LGLLRSGALSKAELSAGLGQKEVSGQLNKVIRLLLADQSIEYTIPDKPSSRLQKYRLTAKAKTTAAVVRPGTVSP
jgi:ATP-dependent DNA helicase RecG